MPAEPALLIIAQSGRALAQAAVRAGFTPLVVDRFGDSDTCSAAAGVRTVSGAGGGLAPESTLAAAGLLLAGQRASVIYGSGLEAQPELIEALARDHELLGNPPEVVRKIKDPASFFALLRRLGIAYPETVFEAADARGSDWLVKRAGACGGGHISRHLPGAPLPAGCYLQRAVRARTISVLFLADGQRAEVIGCCELWHAAGLSETPYLYGGAVRLMQMGRRLQEILQDAAAELVRAAGLRGLCGLDAVVDDEGRAFVLEVNPRPPATFELYHGEGELLTAHIAACRGRLTRCARQNGAPRAHALLYAQRPMPIPADICWPEWSADRPPAGRTLGRGEPVCTVFAQGADSATALQRVNARRRCLEDDLGLREQAA